MKVLIHATCHLNRPSGALTRLICLYVPIVLGHPNVKFFITLASDGPELTELKHLPNVKIIRNSLKVGNRYRRILWTIFRLPKLVMDESIDICEFHSLPFVPMVRCTRVGLIHDLRQIHSSNGLKNFFFRYILFLNTRAVHKIVTVSDTVKNEICQIFDMDFHRVIRVYNPVSKNVIRWKPPLPLGPSIFQTYRKYLISVGHLERRKNLGRLIEAFASCIHNKKVEFDLILVGNDAGEKRKLLGMTKSFGVSERVLIVSDVDEKNKNELVFRSLGAVYPSTEEGFGIPVVEALAMNKRVAVSNIPVFLEIAGENATYFDPFVIDEIADALIRVVSLKDGGKDRETSLKEFLPRYDGEKLAAQLSVEVYGLPQECH